MKRAPLIFVLVLVANCLQAQFSFKTIVPQNPVVLGESFQVQYVVQDGEDLRNLKASSFSFFRVVTGPIVYHGSVATINGVKPLTNTVYTLVPLRTGRFVIPGATALQEGDLVKSNDASIEVISREEANRRHERETSLAASDYILRTGEDPYSKIRQNLFVKMMVDKRSCYVGEPILATFKLYSRLESRSDIVKNPGFYGFTVFDMVNLTDKQVSTENVNGKIFDVHTIRKVQLYPLQAGDFVIDPMLVKNRVEFSRSAVNKRTEQEIVEGVLGEDSDEPAEGAEVFETEIKTEPVTIKVKPVPEKNKPIVFNGATGHYTIAASIVNDKLKRNEEGFLEIRISGTGNFIQLSAPAVSWPGGIEGFEPTVKDELDKTKMPLAGTRIFRYPFVSSSAGSYNVPAVEFSFFDIDSNHYKTISTKPVTVEVSHEQKAAPVTESPKTSIAENSEKAARTAGIVVAALVLIILGYWAFRKKDPEPVIVKVEEKPLPPTTDELLAPAATVMNEEGNRFYSVLHSITWKFVTERFGLSGSGMNKQALTVEMKVKGIDGTVSQKLFRLLSQCENAMFTSAELLYDKQQMLAETKEVFEAIMKETAT